MISVRTATSGRIPRYPRVPSPPAPHASRPGIATVVHMDGNGDQEAKRDTYSVVSAKAGEFVNGFKLFYDEDIDLMTPAEAMALVPRPALISYQ